MKNMHELKELLCRELDEIAEKGELSAGDLDTVHKLTDTIKNIDKIEMLEEDGGYSERGGMWEANGTYGGNSYDDDASYARRKRDSMGRYSRDGGRYNGGSSYNRGGRGEYSRDGGEDHLKQKLHEMMNRAGSEKEREVLRKVMNQLDLD